MGRSKKITTIQIAEPLSEGSEEQQQQGEEAGAVESVQPVKKYPIINIEKAKLSKEDLFLDNVEYTFETKDGTEKAKKECTALVHDDLKFALKKLNEHLCRLSEQYNNQGDLDFMSIVCKGFSVAGKSPNDGVVLSGYRTLDSGSVLNLNTPFTKFNSDYEYISEMGEAIEDCIAEVKAYLFENKHRPEDQHEGLFEGVGPQDPSKAPYSEEGL